ncbi:hypothetical protein HPB47_023583 [Ixodes persulcatus]|uniref:Uncharacterized protein n=1 Tax=Ixodes persulcatus TaxID=34615 RepID=A0AC60Q7P9_IXOPE|nr:hypothetical protein HPB47_023583 [Ixodes persulcatus]
MLSDAWKAVTPDTLRNCFRHARFTLDSESAVETEDPVPDAQSISTKNLIADLRDGGHAVPPAVTFDKFTDMDSALDVCADLTDEEIVRQVLEPDSESDSKDDAPAIVRPSNAELTQALMECHGKGKSKHSLNSGRPMFSEEIDDKLFEFLQEERAAERALLCLRPLKQAAVVLLAQR